MLAFFLIAQFSLSEEKTQIKQYETGGIYDGEFLNGKQHGKGKYTLPNGYYYEGEWKEDKYCGRGTLTRRNGDVVEGRWKDEGDKVICENSNGDCQIIPKHLLW